MIGAGPASLRRRLEEAASALDQVGVRREEVVFVGGVALEALGLRRAHDVDAVATPIARRQLESTVTTRPRGSFEALSLATGLQILKDPYRRLGIGDADLFKQELYFDWEGHRVVRPELELGKKLFRRRPKDREDLVLLERYAVGHRDRWSWDLVPVRPYGETVTTRVQQGLRTPSASIRRAFSRIAHALRSPGSITPSVGGRLRRRLGRSSERPLPVRRLAVPTLDVGVILQRQFSGGEFNRFDVLMRLWTLRQHLAGHQRAFDPYDAMQEQRIGRATRLQFEELVANVQRKGYSRDRSPLILSKDGCLVEGSHRLSCALHWEIDAVPVMIRRVTAPPPYGRTWFEERGFSPMLLRELDLLLQHAIVETGAAFQMILWPPAVDFLDEVVDAIRARYEIVGGVYSGEIIDFPSFLREIYDSDDIERWKIEKKLHHMRDRSRKVAACSFLIPDPTYRAKRRVGSYLCHEVVALKAELRQRFRERVGGYVYDIILHIGDNPVHNRTMVNTMRNHGLMPSLAETERLTPRELGSGEAARTLPAEEC